METGSHMIIHWRVGLRACWVDQVQGHWQPYSDAAVGSGPSQPHCPAQGTSQVGPVSDVGSTLGFESVASN